MRNSLFPVDPVHLRLNVPSMEPPTVIGRAVSQAPEFCSQLVSIEHIASTSTVITLDVMSALVRVKFMYSKNSAFAF